MNIKPVNEKLSVSEQIAPGDMAHIAESGFKAIICNRPDNEAPDQPTFAQIEAAARKAGLQARHIPMAPGKTDPAEAGKEFGKAMAELPKPVLAFCRTGARSTMLWQLSQKG